MRRTSVLAIAFLLALASPALACSPVRRSAAVGRAFQRTHPCPSTGLTTGACRGWVKDHRWPLCAGGADSESNMAWQTVQAARDKDRLERAVCRLQPRPCPHQGD